MAFGFIKKVFSFGKPEDEPVPDETAPLPPLDWSALKPTDELEVPEFLKRDLPPLTSDAEALTESPPDPTPVEPSEPEWPLEPHVPAEEPLESKPAHDGEAQPALDIREAETAAIAETNLPLAETDIGPLSGPPAAEFIDLAPKILPETAAMPAPSVTEPVSGKIVVGKTIAAKAETFQPAPPVQRTTWFQRLREGLSRSSRELTGGIAGIFTKRKLDEETLEELEDVLLRADLGMETAIRVTDALSASRYGKDVSDTEVRVIMAQEIEKVLTPVAVPLELDLSHKPHVILVVGVNGTGKTTTIGKLAAKLTSGGLSVMLAAVDTFRAAAIEQLKIWGERTGSPVVSSKIGADAAGLAWDAFEKARAAGSDVLIIDTAGRLQNRTELMAELEKIVRVLGKHDPEAPHTVLQTVDATTGQNALNQVEIFRNIAGVNGLVMTKLDGTARGGILVAIAAKHKLPVYFIGVGEQVDDLEPFSAGDFAKAIAGVA